MQMTPDAAVAAVTAVVAEIRRKVAEREALFAARQIDPRIDALGSEIATLHMQLRALREPAAYPRDPAGLLFVKAQEREALTASAVLLGKDLDPSAVDRMMKRASQLGPEIEALQASIQEVAA